MAVSELPLIIDRGCGPDVHKDTVVASVKAKILKQKHVLFPLLPNPYMNW